VSDVRGGAFSGIAGKGHGRAATLASIARNARLTRGYLLQVGLATAIAHLGLLMNSSPVVIGAMLISPLLAPIMGFGFAIATFDERLLRRSLQTLGIGTAIAIAVAFALTVVSPITEATPALLARVRPSLLDLLVAVFGGIAGAYALLRKFSATLVGVAIATALIPPLATVGWGLALGRFEYAGGALLLYVTNTAAIGFMATLVARWNGFGTGLSPRQTWLQSGGILLALAILAIPLGFSLSAIVREARSGAVLREALQDSAGEAATIDRFDIDYQARPAVVTAVVIDPAFSPALEKTFAARVRKELGDQARVSVIQLRNGTAEAETRRSQEAATARERELAEREAQRLRAALAVATGAEAGDIVLDLERRAAVVRVRPTLASDHETAETARDPTAAVRAAFPNWRIERIGAPPEEDPVQAERAGRE
jgi:uncharacterized hydrophobic protein (TIGR00271 family)